MSDEGDTKESGETELVLPGPLAAIRRWDKRVQRVEVFVCLVALGLMILLAFTQVVLRQVNGTAIAEALPFIPQPVGWFDLVSRQLVIWVGLLGASLATAEGRHISIEALPKILSDRGKRRVDVLVNLVSVGITVLLLVLCVIWTLRAQLPRESALFVVEALDLKVYSWPFSVVVPVALTLMTLRFLTRALEGVILDDATYAALRNLDEGEDMANLDASQEEIGVSLLMDTARQLAQESGAEFDLDQETARSEVREVLKSDRLDAPAVEAKKPARMQIKAGLRSTDEIETYHPQDLHDDSDKHDPIAQVPADLLDSNDMLEMSDMADVGIVPDVDVDDAMDAAADAARTSAGAERSEERGPLTEEGLHAIALESSDDVMTAPLSDGATERVDVQCPSDDEDGGA